MAAQDADVAAVRAAAAALLAAPSAKLLMAMEQALFAAGGTEALRSCDATIPGEWTGFNPAPLGDTYAMAWAQPPSPGAWTVTMVSGGGWTNGKGQLSADNTTTTVLFDSGVALKGNVSGKCGNIDWDNDSRWAVKPPPPPPITDVVSS